MVAAESATLRGAVGPRWNFLFFSRDYRVYSLHKSLAEWLVAPDTPPPYKVDAAAGERAWAGELHRRAVVNLQDRAAEADAYAVRYLVSHIAAARAWELLPSAVLDFDHWAARDFPVS